MRKKPSAAGRWETTDSVYNSRPSASLLWTFYGGLCHESGPLVNDKLRGIVFDCDGTLADSMPLHWRAWQAVLDKHGLAFNEERFYALGGVPSREIVRLLSDEQGLDVDPFDAARQKEEAYLPLIAQVEPINAIIGIAREHHGKVPLAVASGGTRRVISLVLEHLGIRELFDAVVTSEDVLRQKPAPDIFLEAARRIGVPPHLCRGYEDTDLGLAAIRAAGMEAIDVRHLIDPVRRVERRPAH
jgi:beta-phosphoglucomutase-like phosphatase (HAD superfamily)